MCVCVCVCVVTSDTDVSRARNCRVSTGTARRAEVRGRGGPECRLGCGIDQGKE